MIIEENLLVEIYLGNQALIYKGNSLHMYLGISICEYVYSVQEEWISNALLIKQVMRKEKKLQACFRLE